MVRGNINTAQFLIPIIVLQVKNKKYIIDLQYQYCILVVYIILLVVIPVFYSNSVYYSASCRYKTFVTIDQITYFLKHSKTLIIRKQDIMMIVIKRNY